MFGVALAVRIACLLVYDNPGEISGKETSWDWGFEQAAIAEALARGDGFSDAFARGSGATGWSTPVFPTLLAALVKLFGGIDRPLATALAVLQAVFSAATCVALARLGAAVGGARLGRLAAWLWALHPAAIYYSVNLPWDSTPTALALTWFLALLVARGPSPGAKDAGKLGAAFGAVLLVNPSPFALAPAILAYVARWSGNARARLAAPLAFACATALVCAPWIARNWVQVGSPGLRTNLGVELFVGNNDGAEGRFNGAVHPAYNDAEFARYVELGESAYAEEAFARFRAWASDNPARFAELTAVRVARFWLGRNPLEGIPLSTGRVKPRDWMGWIKWTLHLAGGVLAVAGALALRGRTADRMLLRGVVVLFPLTYYVTHVFERYRLPIEPVLTLLAAGLVLAVLPKTEAPNEPKHSG